MAEKDGKYGVNVYMLECGHRYVDSSDLPNGYTVSCGKCYGENQKGISPLDRYPRQRIERFIEFK